MNNSLQYQEESFLHSLNIRNILLSTGLMLIILLTVVGNLLVIISVLIEKNLRTPSNCLIFSLAISDLIIGLCVMPLRASVIVVGHWPFSFRCDFLFEVKILSIQSSVLHLVFIAIDRYLILSKIQISSSQSKMRIAVMIAIAWIVPILYATAPFLGWHDKNWKLRNNVFNCIGNRDLLYRIIGIFITFYVPVPIIIIFYCLIYKIARDSLRRKCSHNIKQINMNSPTDSHSATDIDYKGKGDNTAEQTVCYKLSTLQKRHSINEQREKKVAKTLTIITSVFLLCWSPFFVLMLIYIRDETMPILSNNIVIWLGLCNSAMNPIIYAYFIPTFRSTFKRILCRK